MKLKNSLIIMTALLVTIVGCGGSGSGSSVTGTTGSTPPPLTWHWEADASPAAQFSDGYPEVSVDDHGNAYAFALASTAQQVYMNGSSVAMYPVPSGGMGTVNAITNGVVLESIKDQSGSTSSVTWTISGSTYINPVSSPKNTTFDVISTDGSLTTLYTDSLSLISTTDGSVVKKIPFPKTPFDSVSALSEVTMHMLVIKNSVNGVTHYLWDGVSDLHQVGNSQTAVVSLDDKNNLFGYVPVGQNQSYGVELTSDGKTVHLPGVDSSDTQDMVSRFSRDGLFGVGLRDFTNDKAIMWIANQAYDVQANTVGIPSGVFIKWISCSPDGQHMALVWNSTGNTGGTAKGFHRVNGVIAH